MQLVKWKRNGIFKAVTAGGLDPAECSFDYDDEAARITHRPSGAYFLLEGNPGPWKVTTVVGDLPPWDVGAYIWPDVEDKARRWAEDVRRDVDTPDLWAELQRDRELLTGARYDDVENTPFSQAEQAEIAEQLRQIKGYAKQNYSLSQAQLASFERKLDFIQAAAARMGRRDWQHLLVGVMLGVIVQDLVPADVVQHTFAMLLQALTHLFAPQLPPLIA